MDPPHVILLQNSRYLWVWQKRNRSCPDHNRVPRLISNTHSMLNISIFKPPVLHLELVESLISFRSMCFTSPSTSLYDPGLDPSYLLTLVPALFLWIYDHDSVNNSRRLIHLDARLTAGVPLIPAFRKTAYLNVNTNRKKEHHLCVSKFSPHLGDVLTWQWARVQKKKMDMLRECGCRLSREFSPCSLSCCSLKLGLLQRLLISTFSQTLRNMSAESLRLWGHRIVAPRLVIQCLVMARSKKRIFCPPRM